MHTLPDEGLQISDYHVPPQNETCVRIPADFFSNWFKSRGRSFPWREKGVSPYGMLLAEVLLKQTRAEMVARVWPSLFSRYPGAAELAFANPEALFRHISYLGFGRQRTAALIQLSAAIGEAGGLPSKPEDLMEFPHVGIYSAHAVACFAFGQRVPVVDLSVVRVLSRLAGLEPPGDIRRAPEVWEMAWSLLPDDEIQEHNYGLLDFAASICKARSPRCDQCPLACTCFHARHFESRRAQDLARCAL